jgi:endoglucanase
MFVNIKKRLLSFAVVVVMIMSTMPTTTLAAEADYTHLVNTTNNIEKPSAGGALQILPKGAVKTLCDAKGVPNSVKGYEYLLATMGTRYNQ